MTLGERLILTFNNQIFSNQIFGGLNVLDKRFKKAF